MTRLALLLGSLSLLQAAPITLINPSAEINNGTDGTLVSDPSFLGWNGTGSVSDGDTDYGNLRWKFLIEDSESILQYTTHQIESGASYSIRFDATASSGVIPVPDNILVGGTRLNGNFNADTSLVDSRPFADTPEWINLSGAQAGEATKLTGALPSFDGSRNAVVSDAGTKVFALDTQHDLKTEDLLRVSFHWRDAGNWDDASDQIEVSLFTTDDNTIDGVRTDIETLLAPLSSADSTYESFAGNFTPIPAPLAGKRLFVTFQGVDGNASSNGFARLDDFQLELITPLLIGPGVRNGDFNEDTSAVDSRTFSNTPSWTNLNGAQSAEATRTNILHDGTRNAVLSQSGGGEVFGNDTEYTLVTGDLLYLSFLWRDAFNWTDGADRVSVSIFTTDDDSITGSQTVLETVITPLSTSDSTFESFSHAFAAIPASADGKRLFISFTTDDGDASNSGFGRVENFQLSVNDPNPNVPPSDTIEATVIVDAIVDNAGTPLVIASQTFPLLSTSINDWHHYHFAIPAGTLDAFAGREIGLRFRGPDAADGAFAAFDNVRFETWAGTAPDGSFSSNWNNSPSQVWTGPGTWANRLHDWQTNNGRINCINGSRERRTMHRVGTSIRGNGGNFSLSVRTGLHAGSNTANARTGFLLGAGPNLDWRGALLVQDSLGRDFGLFLGLRTDGAVAIEDYSTGAVTTLASGTAAGFTNDSRLDLTATYLPGSGEYSLTIDAYNSGNTLLSTATTTLPSDRLLGSFGLLSHRGSNDARFWFDDFSGTGTALNPEPERHLAVIGAMHTLSRGTLKLTAQLPPINLSATSTIALDTWNGASWQQVATTPIDNTDGLSSHNGTFKITGWDDSRDIDYRVRVNVDGSDYHWTGTVRRDPIDKTELVIASTTCQRIADQGLESSGVDWSPVDIWQPHTLAFTHIQKHEPDVLLATGDQIYEGQPTPPDHSSNSNRRYDYLYKWYLWMLQTRDLSRNIPTIAIPDDHDIYQGNLWGEGGISTGSQNAGGYVRPASWVKMVERTQTRNLPDADPYNPTQPAPTVAQGIEVYFTGMTYGRLGFAILEDRKFKTGRDNPPADPNDQFLLGDRQKDFLRAWNEDWQGQDLKLVTSQSPFGNIHTHGSSGYNFGLNDRDTHGWPLHRRNEVWELLRTSRMFQLAGDQHLGSVVHHGILGPRDAGFSFTSPAIANFFPRCWDPVHNAGGTTPTVTPYLGDFFFDGNGTLPSGQPNLTANDPAHIALLAASNPQQYYRQVSGVNPSNLHDRGPGYGIIRVNKATRQITFENWPLYADPQFPQTGSQYADWPVTINQTDNDGRAATGFLPLVDTLAEKSPVISVHDEGSGELVYIMRFPGNLVRLPVYDNGSTYRVEIAYGDAPASEIRTAQTATAMNPAVINSFTALQPSITTGGTATLQWNVESPTTLTIDNGLGDVFAHTIHGIGHLPVSPANNTTYTLTLNGALTAQTSVLVFPMKADWLTTHFTAGELLDPLTSGDDADPDEDGFTNEQEFRFQTDPRDPASTPALTSSIGVASGVATVDFFSAVPLESDQCTLRVEVSNNLQAWSTLPSNSYQEISRDNSPAEGTTRITIRFSEAIVALPGRFYRGVWELN